MGSIPVANPSPLRRWRFSRRVLPLALLGAAAFALIAVMISTAWPEGAKVDRASWIDAGWASDLQVNEPVRVVEGRFWLVKLESGEILALSQKSPYLGCTLPWRPDFELNGRKGWFRDACHSGTFDLTGHCFAPVCPRGMDRFPVEVSGGAIRVDVETTILGPPVDYTLDPVNPAPAE